MTSLSSEASRAKVRVDLQDNDETAILVAAIRKDNPEVVVTHLPGIVKVTSPTELVIRRESVEAASGKTWDPNEFQLQLVTYYGHFSTWDEDEILISWPKH